MKIAVLGTGNVGRALGEGFAKSGHDVVFGSRDPGGKSGLAGPAFSLEEAVVAGEVIVNALPGGATLAILGALDKGALDGKVLADVGNAITERFELLYPNASLGSKLQEALPGVRVVKTLNTIGASIMTDPGVLPAPTTVFLSGNDAEAKKIVSGLLADLGWLPEHQCDLGDISTARGPEHYLFLSVAIMGAVGNTAYGISVVS